jgi:predicted aspartyl protease
MSLLGHFVAEFDAPILEFSIARLGMTQKRKHVNGIIDTGASLLCIPRGLANRLGLRAIRNVATKTAGGTVNAIVYAANVEFGSFGYREELEVLSPENSDDDAPILIGMSVLRQFKIWYHGGLETWSFYRREPHS